MPIIFDLLIAFDSRRWERQVSIVSARPYTLPISVTKLERRTQFVVSRNGSISSWWNMSSRRDSGAEGPR
jgi:hypothetical protein